MPRLLLAARAVAEQVGERQRRAQVGLAAAVLGRVVVALEHPGLVGAHPRDHLRVGQVLALHDDVDLARHAGRLLQRVEVAHAAQVLRHQLAQVGVDAGLRVEREPGQREHEPDQQHALRPLERAAQRRPRAPARRAAAAARAGATRAAPSSSSELAPRRAPSAPSCPPPPRRRAVERASAAVPALSARQNASTMPTTSSSAEAAHHRHRRQQQHEEADARGQRRGGDRRHRDARGAQRVAALLLHPRLVLDRVVDPSPSSTGSTAIEAIVSDAPSSDISPNVIATAASATASGSSRSRLRNTSASTSAITRSATTSSRSSESDARRPGPRPDRRAGRPCSAPFLSCHSFIATAARTSSIARRRWASLRSGLSRTWMTAAFSFGNR